MSDLILPHGGYRKMMSFQISQLVYDVTVRFCKKYIDKRSRTHDQMVQAARSGVQNIAEGSEDSGTSKKIELKLTQVARGSMEELKLDYEDYLRQHNYEIWERNDPRRQGIIDRRCQTAEEVSQWVKQACEKAYVEKGHDVVIQHFEEYSANAALVLVRVACSLLDTHVKRLADDFVKQGGFTERMYRVRKENRNKKNIDE
jgi:four helix bundle suffix protein